MASSKAETWLDEIMEESVSGHLDGYCLLWFNDDYLTIGLRCWLHDMQGDPC